MCKFGPSKGPFLLGDGKKIVCKETFVKQLKKKCLCYKLNISCTHARTLTRTHAVACFRFSASSWGVGRVLLQQMTAVELMEVNNHQRYQSNPDPCHQAPTPQPLQTPRSTDLLYAVMERKDSHQTKFPRKIKRKAPGVNARSKTRWNQEKQIQGARNAFKISSCDVACPLKDAFYCISICLSSSLQLNFTTLLAKLMSGLPDCVKNKSKN